MSIESRTRKHLTDPDLVERPATAALARLRAVRAEQDVLRAQIAELDVVELEAAHAARDGGASWRDLAVAAGLGALSSAQRRYAPKTLDERRVAVAASKVPGVKAEPDNLPGVTLAEAARRLELSEWEVRKRAFRGDLRTVEAIYRGRKIRRIVLDD